MVGVTIVADAAQHMGPETVQAAAPVAEDMKAIKFVKM
jgi:hypothetical protein